MTNRLKKVVEKVSRGIKNTNTIKLMLSVAVGICCVGMGSGEGYAISGGTAGDTSYVDTTSSDPKGIHNIGNPKNSYSTTSGSTYNYIYFGSQSDPIYWRVLNTTSNGYDNSVDSHPTEALFMLTEYSIGTKAWDERNDGTVGTLGQLWSYSGSDASTYADRCSTVRTYLNGTTLSGKVYGTNTDFTFNSYYNKGVYQTRFTDAEQRAIMLTKKTSETLAGYFTYNPPSVSTSTSSNGTTLCYTYNNDSYYAYGSPLEGDYLFLLSGSEVKDSAYGFLGGGTSTKMYSDKNRICKSASEGDASWWWLRSGFSDGCDAAVAVYTDGSSYGNMYGGSGNSSGALRCALNINLASVILTSPASGATATASPSLTIESLSGNAPSATAGSSESTSNASKLRIYDSGRDGFSAGPSTITSKAGNKITIQYSGASTSSNDYISVLIYNSDKSKVYYGAVKKLSGTAASGLATMTLPSDIPTGNGYTLKVLNEAINGPTYTNYAGYKDLTLNITSTGATNTSDTTAPTVNNVYKNGSGTYFKLTASDSGGLSFVTNTGATKVFKGITGLGTSGTCNVPTTSGTTALRVYDAAGNYKDVNSSTVSILQDTTAPTIDSVTYSNGNYIITVSDAESGVWKITDSSGNTLTDADYST